MYTLIGYRHSSGKNSNGEQYSGYYLYIVREIAGDYGKGHMFSLHKGSLATVFLDDKQFAALGLQVGSKIDMYFNESGYVEKSSIRKVVEK